MDEVLERNIGYSYHTAIGEENARCAFIPYASCNRYLGKFYHCFTKTTPKASGPMWLPIVAPT